MSELANKDEALKCLELSKQKHRNGDTNGAIKFAKKSIKLYSTKQAQDWLTFLNNPAAETASNPQQRKKPVVQEKPALPYTPEQTAGIKRILEKKKEGDLYGILGLEKGCSDNDVKKAYRRFALLYHPDKCGAPGTDDAFKAISHAWTVLGDSDKKENYDRYGVDSESSGNRAPNPFQGFQGFGGQQGFEGQISPEELLRMFMGGGGGFQFQTGRGFGFQAGPGFGGARFRTQRNRREREEEQPQGVASVILQFLPVILLFVLSALSLFTSEDDPYSFQRNYEYSLDKQTSRHNVKYYVNPRTFSRKYGTTRKLAELEQRVEQDVRLFLIDKYLNHIRARCNQERETKQFYIRQASSWFSVNEEKLKKAQNMPTPFCDQYSTWYTK